MHTLNRTQIRQMLPVILALAVLVAFLVAQLGATPGQHGDERIRPFEPTRLSDLALLGGSTEASWTFQEMAEKSDMAVVVQVVDVKPSRLNTPDGRFPTAEEIKTNGLTDLTVLTDVEVVVSEVLAATDDSLRNGERMIITVGGGTIFTALSADQAQALGIMEVTVVPSDVAGAPDKEIEVPMNGPVDEFMWGTTPEGELVEGEESLLFIHEIDIPSYVKNAPELRILAPVHSSAMLHRDASRWVNHHGDVAPVAEMSELVG